MGANNDHVPEGQLGALLARLRLRSSYLARVSHDRFYAFLLGEK